jgi:hypothetical protein
MSYVHWPNQAYGSYPGGHSLVTGGGAANSYNRGGWGGKSKLTGTGFFGFGAPNIGREGGQYSPSAFTKERSDYLEDPHYYQTRSVTAAQNAQARARYAQAQRGYGGKRRSTKRRRVAKRKTHRR